MPPVVLRQLSPWLLATCPSGRPLRKALPLASGFWTRTALTRGGAQRRLPHCLGPGRVALGALMSPAGVPRASLSTRGLESGVAIWEAGGS